ncbi:hypothetical protein ATPR_1356 [Acetobacter tropicalis NBRC 101654]|uniref:Uncharacterized protein n=1 Tax=Acetobacter tropicalis NBRC 101654 TaxID=749388 RepID=F7VDA7_9PROT|nr:hypothetical protein ATPR_1356 [Acetobacter tropicalis NBRC 101654]
MRRIFLQRPDSIICLDHTRQTQGIQRLSPPAAFHTERADAAIVLSHPDYHRRLRNYTGSADPAVAGARGLMAG